MASPWGRSKSRSADEPQFPLCSVKKTESEGRDQTEDLAVIHSFYSENKELKEGQNATEPPNPTQTLQLFDNITELQDRLYLLARCYSELTFRAAL